MLILKMAAKNLLRHKRRTVITGAAIAVGLIFYIFIDSLLMGWYGGTEKQYIDYEVASGRIVKKSWWEEKDQLPLPLSIENTAEITSLLDELEIIYTPRTEFFGDLIFYKDPFPEDGVYPVKIVAVDPGTDGEVFELSDAMSHEHSQGEFLQEGNDGIIVGNALAGKLNIEVGYPVRLQFTGRAGSQEIMDTRVIGIIKTGAHLVNINGVFLALDAADYYLEMGGAVSGYSIKVPGGKQGESLLAELKEKLPEEYRLLGYEEIAADFMAMMEMEDSFASLFIFLIFIIAAVGVSNTMMMAIFDRRREIGMMRAQGIQDWKLQIMFFLEAGGLGLIGTVVGLGLGALLNIYLVNVGLNYGALLKTEGDFVDFGGLVIDSYMKGVWSPKSFLTGGICAILISSLVAYFPTHRILKKDIPDNLRMD
jgi:putative ABC transport system permease protein